LYNAVNRDVALCHEGTVTVDCCHFGSGNGTTAGAWADVQTLELVRGGPGN